MQSRISKLIVAWCLALLLTACGRKEGGELALLNVSYDPTRELYADYNKLFAKKWQGKTGKSVTLKQSHGGAGKQARAVIDGLEADVVTLAIGYDVDQMHHKAQLIPKDWQGRLPERSAPYTSTIVFLVRKGNPKNIKDWGDLVRPDVEVVTPNPKTSGGARYNYLAAWGYAVKRLGATPQKAQEFVGKLYGNVRVLDSGARGSTTTFLERGIGDVLLAWENEALLAVKTIGGGKVSLVLPSISVLAEPPVTVVDRYVDKHGTRAVAEAYLAGLYDADAQAIAAKHHYRPRDEAVARRFAADFPKLELFTIEELFGNWSAAQKEHFEDGGVFDRIYRKGTPK